ncbi:MAG: Crp/Fnr family transcriptional regulator [Proteobacteria bacterium]|nr:Crp/Fnr family transcriptional regulator [Pseudomonadota bacterium]
MSEIILEPHDLVAMRTAFDVRHRLSEHAWNIFFEGVSTLSLDVGDTFINAGDASTSGAFISKGLLQAKYITEEGREFIHAFLAEGSIATAYAAALTKQPSKATFEAIELCILFCFDILKFRALFDVDPEWSHIGRLLVEQEYIAKVERIEDLLVASASERFGRFQRKFGALINRLDQKQIALYLGIAPESLSRIRKQRKRNASK